MGIAVVSKQLKICYLVSKQLKKKKLVSLKAAKKTFSRLVDLVVSPTDVKIVYRVVFPSQSLP